MTGSQASRTAVAVFVHGITSSGNTWSPLIQFLENDEAIGPRFALLTFSYPSPKFRFSFTRAIPDYLTLATRLGTFLEDTCAPYDQVILIGHSQGGLIIQRYLSIMLAEARADELERIKLVILLACPNNGSNFMLAHRNLIQRFVFSHAQERELVPIRDDVLRAQALVLRGIVFAKEISASSRPIPFKVYAGEEDKIVTFASAASVFPAPGALPGGHTSIHVPNGPDSEIMNTIRNAFTRAVSGYEQFSNGTALTASPSTLAGPLITVRRGGETYIEVYDLEIARDIMNDRFGSGKV